MVRAGDAGERGDGSEMRGGRASVLRAGRVGGWVAVDARRTGGGDVRRQLMAVGGWQWWSRSATMGGGERPLLIV